MYLVMRVKIYAILLQEHTNIHTYKHTNICGLDFKANAFLYMR